MGSTNFFNLKKTQLKSLDNNTWNINYYSGHENYLFDNNYQQKILSLIDFIESTQYKKPFRYNLEIKTIQFLIALIPENNCVYIATKNLSTELTLLSSDNEQNRPLQEHAQKIAMIPLENTPPQIYLITHMYKLPNFEGDDFIEVHQHTKYLSEQLVSKVSLYKQTWFEKISDFGLDLTANYMLIRIHLLKFLAILPSLDHDHSGREVKRIFLESMLRLVSDSKIATQKKLKGQQRGLPYQYIAIIQLLHFISQLIPAKLLAKTLRFSVELMAKRFIAGENIKLAEKSLTGLIDSNRDATLDQLGELVVSNKEADEYEHQVIEIINGLNQHITAGSKNKSGINQAHVSIKVSALSNDFRPYAFEATYQKVAPRLKNILIAAKKNKVFINIDAEHYHYRDVVLSIYSKVLLETEELKDYKDTGIVVQAYLRDAHLHFNQVLELARNRNICMPIRLVKGAYWDVETVEADAHNFDAPEFLNKEETDIHFRQIVYLSLENSEYIQLAIASHNIQDHCFAEAVREKIFPDAAIIEHQCLHMTYEALSVGLSLMDWPTRNYIPIGNLLVGMAYLVRRIMENSSQVGILTVMRSHKKAMSFKTPSDLLKEKFLNKKLIYDQSISEISKNFKNIYPLRTYLNHHNSYVQKNIDLLLSNLKNGKLAFNSGHIEKISSSNPDLIIGKYSEDEVDSVNEKISKLYDTFISGDWSKNDSKRYEKLSVFAQLLLLNREDLTALIMVEAGKTLDEAIADVDEAIDFINFYIKENIQIKNSQPQYQAKGVFGIIAPWNFPLAIPVGMATAALCVGNTVLLKPAEQTPLIALKLIELARLAGIDESAFDIALGEAPIGKAIVDHKLINGVIFTGSKAVGVEIYRKLKSQFTDSSYPFVPIPKTVITEMGGKNAIIVTNNCELDETVSGIIYSAFAHAGQKCSAASRIIIDKEIKEAFIARFIQAVRDLKVGKSYEYDTIINPLISKEDQQRVKSMASLAADEVNKYGGRILLDDSSKDYPGFCVGPSVFEIPFNRALDKDSVAQKEIFGPIVHIIAYEHLEEAIELFNSTQYALTGGIFCQSQNDIDYLAPKLQAGNLYINRPNTGARVAIEPFGGFKMSGTGPKAGSNDYLYSFMHIPKTPNIDSITFDDFTGIEDTPNILKPSGVSWRSRVEKLQNMIDQIVANYEVYFLHINERDKELLQDFKNYITLNNIALKEYPNKKIPGQISFTQKNIGLNKGAFILSNKEISLSTFMEVLVNCFLGNGVCIFCLNDYIYQRWQNLIKLFYNLGFSSFNIAISKSNKSQLIKILETNKYGFIVFDYNKHLYEQASQVCLSNITTGLPRLYISDIDFDLGDWEGYISKFTHSKSFAINTMRHGAPLEIDLT